ncbi:class I SAM-dependent methyltransferase [Sphingomicrobium lutaoense]|uniref:Putative methyltransferase n=1 Tax=Sphingomicrobium lutaoense TaxID=515949 RepID=A0A839Z3J7_9SPHN|nr:class I SAM-dependent methyltransferase [Sphingomicrobium lutaoense]MBB3764145.1 putative methyltransferase [Sphingomicrobium lutaoense]
MKLIAWSLAASLAVSSAAQAEPANIAAAVANDDRIDENEARDAERMPVEVLSWAGLEKGDRVLDLFGGNLYWGEIIAPAVGEEGHLTIWQPTQFFQPGAREAAGAFFGSQPNVSIVSTPFEGITLGEDAYDFILVNLNVHDFWWSSERFGIPEMDPDRIAVELADALAPGGRLLVIDHRGNAGEDVRAQVEATHRIDPDVVAALFGRAGLRLMETSDLLANPEDDRSVSVFDEKVRGNTDRFMHLYVKPE